MTMDRRTLSVTINHDLAGKTISLAAFQKVVAGWVAAVPPEHFASATVEFPEDYIDQGTAEIIVRYEYPEPDADFAERTRKETLAAQARELQRRHADLQTLARLKAQYPEAQ